MKENLGIWNIENFLETSLLNKRIAAKVAETFKIFWEFKKFSTLRNLLGSLSISNLQPSIKDVKTNQKTSKSPPNI